MGIFAALVCFAGALDIPYYFDHYSWGTDDLSQVSTIYGPGVFFSWLLGVNTYMFDEYLANRNMAPAEKPNTDRCRYVLILTYGLIAFGEQIRRAYRSEFGPPTAAARYVGDKAFESFAIIFAMRIWWAHGQRTHQMRESGTGGHRSSRYSYWPPFVFFFAWVTARAFEYQPGKTHYPIP